MDQKINSGNSISGNSINGERISGDRITGERIDGERVSGNRIAGDRISGDRIDDECVSGEHVSCDRITQVIEKYSDMVRRICFLYLNNMADVEDVFQEVFLKFLINYDSFQNAEHEKAWLCKVTFNQCKDLKKSFRNNNVSSLEDMEIPYESPEQSDLITTVLSLPPDLRQVIYLHFYEDMTVPKIAELLNKNTNTIYTMLRRAKSKLKVKLKEEFCDGAI